MANLNRNRELEFARGGDWGDERGWIVVILAIDYETILLGVRFRWRECVGWKEGKEEMIGGRESLDRLVEEFEGAC